MSQEIITNGFRLVFCELSAVGAKWAVEKTPYNVPARLYPCPTIPQGLVLTKFISSVPGLEPQYCGEQGVAQEVHLSARMGEPRQPETESRRRIPSEVPGGKNILTCPLWATSLPLRVIPVWTYIVVIPGLTFCSTVPPCRATCKYNVEEKC